MFVKRRRILWLLAGVAFLACLAMLIPASPVYLPRLMGSYLLGEDGRSLRGWVKALHHDDPEVRSQASHALGRMGADAADAVPALAEVLLEDPSRGARIEAALALTKMAPASKAAVPALAQALEDPEPFVRMNAALALMKLRTEARPAIPALLEALKAKRNDTNLKAFHATIQEVVALTLGWASAGTDEAVQGLNEALTPSASPGMRLSIARALGEVGEPARSTAPRLRALLKDPDPDISRAAGVSLKKIGASESVPKK